MGEWSGVQILAGKRDFSVLQNIQTSSWAHPVSDSMGIMVLSKGYSAQGMILTTGQYAFTFTTRFIIQKFYILPTGYFFNNSQIKQ